MKNQKCIQDECLFNNQNGNCKKGGRKQMLYQCPYKSPRGKSI